MKIRNILIILYIFSMVVLTCCSIKKLLRQLSPEDRIVLKGLLKSDNESLIPDLSLPVLKLPHLDKRSIPRTFDVRIKWPFCKEVFNYTHEQKACGGCWAFGTASILAQRHCIETKGKVQFYYSAQDILECTYQGARQKDGCVGGQPSDALRRWTSWGIVSGKHYGSYEGCKPYSGRAYFNGTAGECKKKCSNGYHYRLYEDDLQFGTKVYRVLAPVTQIQQEIMSRGPVVANWVVFPNFFTYKKGVYRWDGKDWDRNPDGQRRFYGHATPILGWGVENGVQYWLLKNSWGPKWGPTKDGLVKFLRGKNHCLIEEVIYAATTLSILSPREQFVYPESRSTTNSLSMACWLLLCLTLIYTVHAYLFK